MLTAGGLWLIAGPTSAASPMRPTSRATLAFAAAITFSSGLAGAEHLLAFALGGLAGRRVQGRALDHERERPQPVPA